MDTTSSFSPYGHDLRMLTFAPPSTWEPSFPVARANPPLAGNLDAINASSTQTTARSSSDSDHASNPSSSFHSSPISNHTSPLVHSTVSALATPPHSHLSPLNLPTSHPPPVSETCHLLSLPPELLDQVLAYVLPYTTQTQKGIAWVRRSTALLSTCRTMHEAGARHLYGTNTFVLRTSFTGTQWHLSWIRPRTIFLRSTSRGIVDGGRTGQTNGRQRTSERSEQFLGAAIPGETYLPPSSAPSAAAAAAMANGTYVYGRGPSTAVFSLAAPDSDVPLVPSRLKPFPGAIAEKYLRLLRFVAVEIRVEDAYTGAIKYGFGGPGLADGVRWQVKRLMDVLGKAEELRRLVIRLAGLGTGRSDEERNILEPVASLRNVGTLEIESGWPA
jgi:hypothetical protein